MFSGVLFKFYILFLVGIVCYLAYNFTLRDINKDTLVLVHVVARHGQRTPEPLTTYPNDIHKNNSYLPDGPGRLTKKGLQQAYNVGKLLRQRYDTFLGPDYFYGLVEATSSATNRCITSMEAILATLFPNSPLLPNYTYSTLQEDHMITVHYNCPELLKVNVSDPKHLCKAYRQVVEVLNKYSGINVSLAMQVTSFYDLFYTQSEMGLRIPDWAYQIWPQPLTSCSNTYLLAMFDNRKAVSYFAGGLMKKILDDTKRKIFGESGKTKMYLYTAHDITLAALLGILRSYSGFIINSSAFLMYELHKIDDVYGFKVYLENYQGSKPVLLDIPSCGTFCAVDKILKMSDMYFPTDWCVLN